MHKQYQRSRNGGTGKGLNTRYGWVMYCSWKSLIDPVYTRQPYTAVLGLPTNINFRCYVLLMWFCRISIKYNLTTTKYYIYTLHYVNMSAMYHNKTFCLRYIMYSGPVFAKQFEFECRMIKILHMQGCVYLCMNKMI